MDTVAELVRAGRERAGAAIDTRPEPLTATVYERLTDTWWVTTPIPGGKGCRRRPHHGR